MAKTKDRKTHYHSTAGRRDFMKAIGIGTFALAGTSSFGAPFKDLDEMMASPMAERKLPFWVKEDKPTVEIDWDNMEVFPNPMMPLFNHKYWEGNSWEKIRDKNIRTATEKVKNKTPGYSLHDHAPWRCQLLGMGAHRSGSLLDRSRRETAFRVGASHNVLHAGSLSRLKARAEFCCHGVF